MRLALRLARRGYGTTSPNPMVGAVLVKGGKIIGRGWHRQAGNPHAEIEALRDAQQRAHNSRGATLYVTLEPCSTHGRTPPCTEAIITAGIKCVVVGATDPNPKHAGRGLKILQRAGIQVVCWGGTPSRPDQKAKRSRTDVPAACQKIAQECTLLNEAFNHWIIHRRPLVTVKAAMTLDGKIATAGGESKWITGEKARAFAMHLRRGSAAILVGVNTILTDDPSLTVRVPEKIQDSTFNGSPARLRRFVLDSRARTPLTAKVVSDAHAALTTIVVGRSAPRSRVAALARRVNVLVAPQIKPADDRHPLLINLRWLLRKLGDENVTSLLVEGGGEVNASFLLGGLAQRVVLFYAPKILGGRDARKAVAGDGIKSVREVIPLSQIKCRKIGSDLLLTGKLNFSA